MIKKYLQYIKEADEVEQVQSQQETSDPSKYEEVSSAVKTMIEKTIEKSGGEFSSFVDSLLKNPEDVKIEGFINDSDIIVEDQYIVRNDRISIISYSISGRQGFRCQC